jgi:hypothetical protein
LPRRLRLAGFGIGFYDLIALECQQVQPFRFSSVFGVNLGKIGFSLCSRDEKFSHLGRESR